jgi:FkbM family methyltransferase
MATDAPAQRLASLHSETPEKAHQRAEKAYDCATGSLGKNIVLFGAGRFGRLVLSKLRRVHLEPLAFADNNESIWGTEIDGVPVCSRTDAAKKHGANAAFIVTIWNGEARDAMRNRVEQLKGLGCKVVIPFGALFWKHHEVFLPHYCLGLPEGVLRQADSVLAAMNLWSDEASRREYVAQVEFRLKMEFDVFSRQVEGTHYFPADLIWLRDDEVFVDCGAFDGDTIRDFVEITGGKFNRLYAFEPDPMTYPRLRDRVSKFEPELREKVNTVQGACGRKPSTIEFEATGTMTSTAGSGTTVVDVTDLDTALEGLNPTYIKFDVEGFEPHALMGASDVLARSRPILAISSYHQQDHLWKLPLLAASLTQAGYSFFLRPHGTESWDLVCYAIPEERVPRL